MSSRPTHKIDASRKILGRLATEVAILLRGKNKTIFTPNVDCGDQVVVYNVDNIRTTGRKKETKMYFSHSGYLGHDKEIPLGDMPSDKVFMLAVSGMLPSNKLKSKWMKRLKVYKTEIPKREK